MRLLSSLLLLLLLGGCVRAPLVAERGDHAHDTLGTTLALPSASGPPLVWSQVTASPNPTSSSEGTRELATNCGELDSRLTQVASWLLVRGSVVGHEDDIGLVTFLARAFGAPYVGPAAWSRSSQTGSDPTDESRALSRWAMNFEPGSHLRCGLAQGDLPGRRLVIAVAAMAHADLVKPLPTTARVGQWLEFAAELHIEVSEAKVVLLGPDGDPWSVPTVREGRLVRARFPASRPGKWAVQLLVNGPSGPQQVLEALLFVDSARPTAYELEPAPGESAAAPGSVSLRESSTELLDRMVTLLRIQAGRPVLRRDPTLDRLAVAHADSMRRASHMGHDVGNGSTTERLASAGFAARLAGENVAHATSVVRAHRALWASPSHRSNLLNRGFSRWGLGVVADDDRSLWICELFASED